MTVVSEGRVVSCTAPASSGLTVTSGGVDIAGTPAAVDVDGDGRVDLLATAAEELTEAVEVEVSCVDAWDQSGSATMSAQ